MLKVFCSLSKRAAEWIRRGSFFRLFSLLPWTCLFVFIWNWSNSTRFFSSLYEFFFTLDYFPIFFKSAFIIFFLVIRAYERNDLDFFFPQRYFPPIEIVHFEFFSSRAIHFHSLPNSLCYCSTISLLSQSLSVYVLFCRTSNLLLQTCTFWIAITFSIYFVFIVIHHFAKWVDGTVRCLHKIKYFGETHVWRWHNTPYIRFQWGLHIASVFCMKRRFFLHQFHLPISTLQIIIFVTFAVVVARDTKSCHTYRIKIYIRDDFVSIRSMPSAYFFLFWIIIFLPFNSHEKPKICQLNRIFP